MRDDLRPYVNLAIAAAADQGAGGALRQVLGKARYAELRQIMRDLEARHGRGAAARRTGPARRRRGPAG